VNAASDGAFAKITSSMRTLAGRKTIAADSTKVTKDRTSAAHFSFSYSALACFRMGMSGSASCVWKVLRHLPIESVDFLGADVTHHKR